MQAMAVNEVQGRVKHGLLAARHVRHTWLRSTHGCHRFACKGYETTVSVLVRSLRAAFVLGERA
jgi:hypothetical protein